MKAIHFDKGGEFTAEDMVRLASKALLRKTTTPLFQVIFAQCNGSQCAWVRATPNMAQTNFFVDPNGNRI